VHTAIIVKLRTPQVVQKPLVMNKFVCTKSHTGSKFSKTTLRLLCTWMIVVVHLYCSFSTRR